MYYPSFIYSQGSFIERASKEIDNNEIKKCEIKSFIGVSSFLSLKKSRIIVGSMNK